MERFKNLSVIKKIVLIIAVVLFLLISVVKTYFPQVGLSTWKSNINYIYSGKSGDAENKGLTVYYLDVGQGDCTLIKTEKGCALIDCGNSVDGETISKFLLSHNVDSIDYLVITHPHSDHYGGAIRLLDFVKVKSVLMPEVPEELYSDEKSFIYLIGILNKNNVPFLAARAGDKYEIGDAVFTVLSPVSQTDNLNDMSVVLRLDYANTSFLFMGDAEENVETALIQSDNNLDCDVLKVGHHGSSKGTSKAFLDAVDPYIAIISCGYDNEYGHPAEDTLYRIKKCGASYLRTDINGTVIIGSDGEKLYCQFEKGKRY